VNGPRTCLDFTEFIWNNLGVFSFKMYAVVAAPFDTPKILYLQHHRAGSDGWRSDFFCDHCFDEFKTVLSPVVGNCSHGESCICNVCFRQPPTLTGSASHVVLHLTFNVVQFALTNRTLYEQYRYAVHSNYVPKCKLVPQTYPVLRCNFVRWRHFGIKRFPDGCVSPSKRMPVMLSTFLDETIETLMDDRNYW